MSSHSVEKLVGHFPVCGWLCVSASFVKHRTVSIASGWVTDALLKNMNDVIVARVCQNDPAHGKHKWTDL